MTDHGYARGLAVWARNPSGFTWDEVKPDYVPASVSNIREWAHQDCRDAGVASKALDDAFNLIDAVFQQAEN